MKIEFMSDDRTMFYTGNYEYNMETGECECQINREFCRRCMRKITYAERLKVEERLELFLEKEINKNIKS